MPSLTLTSTVNAPNDVVFDVLTDHRGYARISPLRKSLLEREGDPAPNGVGAIRALYAVGPPIREEVTEYLARDGLPARRDRAARRRRAQGR
jgi:hypothetical protein